MSEISQHQPMPEANFGQVIGRFWSLGFTFTGRASRGEYWGWGLVNLAIWAVLTVAIPLALGIGEIHLRTGALGPIFGTIDVFSTAGLADPLPSWLSWTVAAWLVVTFVPSFALLSRRLHDANFSALWTALVLLPPFSLIPVLMCLRSSRPEGVRFDLVREVVETHAARS